MSLQSLIKQQILRAVPKDIRQPLPLIHPSEQPRFAKSLMATRISALSVRELENSFVPKLLYCKSTKGLKKIHAQIVKLSLSQSNFLVTKMVDVCDNSGDLRYAGLLFEQVMDPNMFLFNAMIRAYTHNQTYDLTINVYKQMPREAENQKLPDKFTFPFVIKSCAAIFCEVLGRQVHAQVCKFGPKSHLLIENALMDLYLKCDNLADAHKVFDGMSEPDVISWNSLLSGYVRLGKMRGARAVFEEIPNKTIVSWTAMVSGYTRIGCYAEALDMFRRMQMLDIEPDEISVVSVLPACAQLGALEVGKWIHMYSEKKQLLQSVSVCNALIEMYVKCGCIDQAWHLFDQMLERDVISWSTMIAGLANYGKAREAVELFQEMQIVKVEPNGVTFLGLLSACTHAGLWNEGVKYFDSMREDHNIEPEIEHYGCLVDLLGRAGHLDQALDRINKMPMNPGSKIWGSLLSSCRTHCNLEIAITAMEHLSVLEPDDAGNYVLLSNIYADLGKWEDVSRMRKLIRSKSMKRTPGCSSIEVDNVVMEFVAGDDSKPFARDIFSMLELLLSEQNIPDDKLDATPEDCSQLLLKSGDTRAEKRPENKTVNLTYSFRNLNCFLLIDGYPQVATHCIPLAVLPELYNLTKVGFADEEANGQRKMVLELSRQVGNWRRRKISNQYKMTQGQQNYQKFGSKVDQFH